MPQAAAPPPCTPGHSPAAGPRPHLYTTPQPQTTTHWHYHVCDFNFVYFLKGTVTFELEDGTVSTFKEGESIFIPGGFRHNEIYMSPDLEAIEFSMPGDIGTVIVDRPAHLPEVLTPSDSENPG